MNFKRRFIYDDFRISEEHTKTGFTMPYAHCHASYEIYILESGQREVTAENTGYTVTAHDATLFPSNMPHKSCGNTAFSGICIHFSRHYLDLYFSSAATDQLMKCFRHRVIRLNERDFDTVKEIADTFCENAPNNFLKLASVLDILNRSSVPADAKTPSADAAKKKKSQKIIEYVNENYACINRISTITEIFDVSENYVFVLFRKNYNMTPKQYINNLRINHVCHQLGCSDKSIKSIAYDCGFNSYEHFTGVFKKTVGCTPTEYRNRIHTTSAIAADPHPW